MTETNEVQNASGQARAPNFEKVNEFAYSHGATTENEGENEGETRWHQLGEDALERAEQVYVPAGEVEVFHKKNFHRSSTGLDSKHRTLLIAGPEGSGRTVCATWLSMQLVGGTSRTVWAPGFGAAGLSDLFRYRTMQPESVYLIENVFQGSVAPTELSNEFLEILGGELEGSNSWLILTGGKRDTSSRHNRWAQWLKVEESGDTDFLRKVFDRHLNFYLDGLQRSQHSFGITDEVADLLRDLEEKEQLITRRFRTAAQVARFLDELELNGIVSRDGKETPKQTLTRMADDIAAVNRQQAKTWFENAHPNVRLFAMTASLWEPGDEQEKGLDRRLIEDVYSDLAHHLKHDGVKVSDPRDFSLDELIRNSRLQVKPDNSLRFSCPLSRRETVRQLPNYQHLLWSLAPKICQWIEAAAEREHRQFGNQDVGQVFIGEKLTDAAWRFRATLGQGLGKIGISQWSKLVSHLNQFAQDDRHPVAAVPGYALRAAIDQLIQSEALDELQQVPDLLLMWAKNANPRFRWAALGAVWRCYPSLVRGLNRVDQEESETPRSNKEKEQFRQIQNALNQLDDVLENAAERIFTVDLVTTDEVHPESGLPRRFHHNHEALLRALSEMFKCDPDRVTDLICRWIGATTPQPDEIEDNADNEPEAEEADGPSAIAESVPNTKQKSGEKIPLEEPIDEHDLPEENPSENDELQGPGPQQEQELAAALPDQDIQAPADEERNEEPQEKPQTEPVEEQNKNTEAENSEAETEDSQPVQAGEEQTTKIQNVGDPTNAPSIHEILQSVAAFHFGVVIAYRLFSQYRDPQRMLDRTHMPLLRLIEPLLSMSEEKFSFEESAYDTQYGSAQAAIDHLLEVVAEWLQQESWESRIVSMLTRALNRSRLGPRNRFCRHLTNNWLDDSRPRLREVAARLLARAVVVNGSPVDPPGKAGGLLVLESELGLMRLGGVLVSSQYFHWLNAQVELRIGYLGVNRWFESPRTLETSPEFRLDREPPLLLVPLIEQVNFQETTFALILTNRPPCDVNDLLHPPFEGWGSKIIVDTTAPQAADILPVLVNLPVYLHEAHGLRNIESYTNESARDRIRANVDKLLLRIHSERSAEEWNHLMRDYLPLASDADIQDEIIRDWIETLAAGLDEEKPSEPIDPARLISSGIQWLFARNPHMAVKLLVDWMDWPDDSSILSLSRSFSLVLLNLVCAIPVELPGEHQQEEFNPGLTSPEEYERLKKEWDNRETTSATVLPAITQYDALLQLGPALVRSEDFHGFKQLLRWVRRWIHDPKWSERFRASFQRPGGNELCETLREIPPFPDWRLRTARMLEEWNAPLASIGETEAPQAAKDLSALLKFRLLLGPQKPRPTFDEGDRVLVLLVDAGRINSVERRRNAQTATRLLRQLADLKKNHCPNLKTVVYRLGREEPAVSPGEMIRFDQLLPAELPEPASLMAPIIEQLPIERATTTVLIANRPPLDWQDCQADLLATRAHGVIFTRVPESFSGSPWEVCSSVRRNPHQAAEWILSRVRPRLERGSYDNES